MQMTRKKRRRKLLPILCTMRLMHGASFKDMVAQYSTDNISFQSGGLLPEFGTGRYSEAFEAAAFGLAKDGEVSKPVLTGFGYHILQRVEHVPVNKDKTNAAAMALLKQSVQADKRIGVAKQMLAQKVMKTAGFKNAAYVNQALQLYADSVYAGKQPKQTPVMNNKTPLFSFPQQTVTAGDFAKYINSIKNTPELLRGKSTPQLVQQYAETVAMEYYRNHLEAYNKEFASQLKEFKDGNLLFEIMQRKVWDKAAADSVGLKNYYNNNKNKYWWEASADAILFTCSDSASAAKAKSNCLYKRPIRTGKHRCKTVMALCRQIPAGLK